MIDLRNWTSRLDIETSSRFYYMYIHHHQDVQLRSPFPGFTIIPTNLENYIESSLFQYLNLYIGLNILPNYSINIEDRIYTFPRIENPKFIQNPTFRKFTIHE